MKRKPEIIQDLKKLSITVSEKELDGILEFKFAFKLLENEI